MEIHTWETFRFLILATLCIRGKADFSCFSSNSSEAKDIRLVYDKHPDETNLWERNPSEPNPSEPNPSEPNPSEPNPSQLAPCDFSSIFSSKCSVCLSDSTGPGTVLLVLWNLTGSEELQMEGGNRKLFFNKIDCPRPEPVSTAGAVTKSGLFQPNNQRGTIRICIFLGCFITLLLIIIWLAWKHHKSQKASVDGSNSVSFDSGNSSAVISTPRNGSVV